MDKITPDVRSSNMRAIKGRDTAPEMTVRRVLRQLGFPGYRVHRKDLPGKPDIAFIGRKKVVLVHGCFWHGHDCPVGLRRPQSRQDYWVPKIARNQARDAKHLAALASMGWRILVIWECEVHGPHLTRRLREFMETP